jgi:membrane protease YdiL (CAAX protease family)
MSVMAVFMAVAPVRNYGWLVYDEAKVDAQGGMRGCWLVTRMRRGLDKIMSKKQLIWLSVMRAFLAGVIFAFVAGSVSTNLATWLVSIGGPPFLREPLNLIMALLFLVLWSRWQPAAAYSPPKWGQAAIGLPLGLLVGIALPAVALWSISSLGAATIKAPQIEPVALLVPFIFLIAHAFAEESLVRAIAQRTAHYAFGDLAGVVISGLCFTALQALQGYLSAPHVINSFLFGACLGFLVLGRGGIWAAIGAHAGWSWLETSVLGQAGQIVKTGSWLGGVGADSYGSPIFSVVVLITLGLQISLHLRAQKRTA